VDTLDGGDETDIGERDSARLDSILLPSGDTVNRECPGESPLFILDDDLLRRVAVVIIGFSAFSDVACCTTKF
jgi:hypothetical protein